MTHFNKNRKNSWRLLTLAVLSGMGMSLVPAQEDDFSNLYGTYKMAVTESTGNEFDQYTGVLFVVRSPKYQSYKTASTVHIRPTNSAFFSGVMEYRKSAGKSPFRITYKKSGKYHHDLCALDISTKSNTRFYCEDHMRAKSYAEKFTLTKLTGKTEGSFLSDFFQLNAESFLDKDGLVGTYKIASGSSDLKQTNTVVTLRKGTKSFLDASIKNELSNFEGVVIPSGKRSVYIRYSDDTSGKRYETDCLFSLHSQTQKVKMMHCQGTLQGVHKVSEYDSFNLTHLP